MNPNEIPTLPQDHDPPVQLARMVALEALLSYVNDNELPVPTSIFTVPGDDFDIDVSVSTRDDYDEWCAPATLVTRSVSHHTLDVTDQWSEFVIVKSIISWLTPENKTLVMQATQVLPKGDSRAQFYTGI